MGPLKRLTRRRAKPPASEGNPRSQAHPIPGWQSIASSDDSIPGEDPPREPVLVMATPDPPSEASGASPTVTVDPSGVVAPDGQADTDGPADAVDPAAAAPVAAADPAGPAPAATHDWTAEERPYDRLDCPACGTIFQELPDAVAGCLACDATIHVLTCPEGVRHLLTAADVEAFDDDWDGLHVRRKREEAQRRNAVALQARRAALASYAELGVRLVELRTASGACPACVAAAVRPYRPRAAPALPIKGCRRDICRCVYAPARPRPARR